MNKLLKALFLILIIAALVRSSIKLDYYRVIPQCQEDAVLVGVGDFENGRWTRYVCGPALDDCTAVKQWQPYIP